MCTVRSMKSVGPGVLGVLFFLAEFGGQSEGLTLAFEEGQTDGAVDGRLGVLDAAPDVGQLGAEPKAAVEQFGHLHGQRLCGEAQENEITT